MTDQHDRDEPEWPTVEPTDESDNCPDTAIVPYVQALNRAGVETLQSCSGHRHSDGTRSDGHLWFDAPLETAVLVECDDIMYVKRMFKPEHCWEIIFPGMAESEAAFERAMDAVFRATRVPMEEVNNA